MPEAATRAADPKGKVRYPICLFALMSLFSSLSRLPIHLSPSFSSSPRIIHHAQPLAPYPPRLLLSHWKHPGCLSHPVPPPGPGCNPAAAGMRRRQKHPVHPLRRSRRRRGPFVAVLPRLLTLHGVDTRSWDFTACDIEPEIIGKCARNLRSLQVTWPSSECTATVAPPG